MKFENHENYLTFRETKPNTFRETKPNKVPDLLLIREDQPVLFEHLPYIVHDDMAGAEQDKEWRGGGVEPVKQHLRHLPLLLS